MRYFPLQFTFNAPFQAPLDTCLDSPLLCQPLSSRFALHGLRALEETLLSFSSLIRDDFWVLLSFLCDRSVFVPSDKCAGSTAMAGKIKKKPEILTLLSKENINKEDRLSPSFQMLPEPCVRRAWVQMSNGIFMRTRHKHCLKHLKNEIHACKTR